VTAGLLDALAPALAIAKERGCDLPKALSIWEKRQWRAAKAAPAEPAARSNVILFRPTARPQ
jgi:hypothetical protein